MACRAVAHLDFAKLSTHKADEVLTRLAPEVLVIDCRIQVAQVVQACHGQGAVFSACRSSAKLVQGVMSRQIHPKKFAVSQILSGSQMY